MAVIVKNLSRSVRRDLRKMFPGEIKADSKYFNQEVKSDGFIFKSIKEEARYRTLRMSEKLGFISDLKVHPKFRLIVNGIKIASYESDFSYKPLGLTSLRVEDVKAIDKKTGKFRTTEGYRIKKRLMMALLNIKITER